MNRSPSTRSLVPGLLALAFLLLGSASLAEAQRPRPSPEQVAEARRLFIEGSQHYEAGRLEPALQAFLGSWTAVRNPQLAYNVARTYERIGDAPHAVEFYAYYLRHAAPDAAERADVQRRIAEIRDIERRQQEQIMTAPPSSDELTREARTFFERGVAMFRRRQFEAAMAAFTAAYNFARLPEVIYNLAVTAERLERTQDAVDYFREYARTLPRDGAERAIIDRRVRELRAQR